MSGSQWEPTDEDGPLIRAAHRQADAVDRSETPAERRRGWAGLIPVAMAALAEGFLRQQLISGAVLASLIVLGIGATSGDPAWTVAYCAVGIAGIVLVFSSLARHWAFGRQWAAILSVFVLQILLMVGYWQGH